MVLKLKEYLKCVRKLLGREKLAHFKTKQKLRTSSILEFKL